MKILSGAEFASRREGLEADLAVAKKRYGEACRANAVGAGSDAEQREAKDALDLLDDKLGALRAAWEEQVKQQRRASGEQTRRDWGRSVDKVSIIAREAQDIADALEPLRVQVAALANQYVDAYARIREVCRRHKLGARGIFPGSQLGSSLRNFNSGAVAAASAAKAPAIAIAELQAACRRLEPESAAAINDLEPAGTRQEEIV